MKKPYMSLSINTVFFCSLFLSACSDQLQPKQALDSEDNTQIITTSHNIYTSSFTTSDFNNIPSDSSAHWLTSQLLVLPKTNSNYKYSLINKSSSGFNSINLSEAFFPENTIEQFPHLANFQAYRVNLSSSQAKAWLKQQLIVISLNKENKLQKLSYVQTASVIDALYTQGDSDANEEKNLGAIATNNGVNFKLWAPTAQQVEVLLFGENLTAKPSPLPMTEDANTGIWSLVEENAHNGDFYQYQVTVYHPKSKKVEKLITTDPYSLSLSINSKHSQIVNLNDSNTQPTNWKSHKIPTVKNAEDNIFYETHIRDFSADDNALSNSAYSGKYKAFSEKDSHGIKHLKTLKKAGLNNIHLLPTFDIATVNESADKVVNLQDSLKDVKAKVCKKSPNISLCKEGDNDKQTLKSLLESFDTNTAQAQKIVSELRKFDNYNWGYDPYHYTVPEGSYALNPQGMSRLVEFREMVQSLHNLGFRVIMDVVYNHTHQAGLEPNAVLDKIVPNYYHRLNPITAAIEQSTCCDNTATERVMMEKLMTDSLVVWARDYKIDGFRFDLMGHQPKAAMLAAREAVRQVDKDTYFYGEGWNFGEVASNSQFIQASQLELGGTSIGTYTDRLRDAVRGGGNNTRDIQGVSNGLLTQPNERQTIAQSRQEYELRMDQLRIGLAGNLANFPLRIIGGKKVFGKDIPYGDQPTGYALDPADTINYVSKHDNQTLWDNSQYRLPFDTSTEDRVRMHIQSLSFALFAQGIPFIHMGSEFMRSKSFLRDSYDYGDWFNRVDFSKQTNHYNIGLPPRDKDQKNWPLIKEVLQGHQGRDYVETKHIEYSAKVFEEMVALRMSSPLFRLTTAEDIIEKVSFLNVDKQQLGLLVMKLDDTQGKLTDDNAKTLMVIFNISNEAKTFSYPEASDYKLHPIQREGIDEMLKQSVADSTGFTVPALSSVVFVKE